MNCSVFVQHTLSKFVSDCCGFLHTLLLISTLDCGEFHQGLKSEKNWTVNLMNFSNTLLVISTVNCSDFYNTL